MSALSKIFHPSGNIEEVCFLVCELLGLRYTELWLRHSLRESAYYPSMLSIYDLLRDYGVSPEAYKCELKKLEKVSWPFIVQVAKDHEGGDKRFALVLDATKGVVTWKNPYSGKWENMLMDSFAEMFTGYVMFFEKGKEAGEKDYWRHLREEIAEYVTTAGMVLFLPILFVVAVLWLFLVDESLWVSSCVYGGLLLVGCCVGGLLLAHEYDAYSPVVRRFCGSSGKVSCDAVLSSKGSTLWGIPWTVIGGGYFVGSLSAMTVSCFDAGVMSLLAWVHVLTLPYIGYSLYYQRRVVGQWCPLCLTVLVVTAGLFGTALAGGMYGDWREIGMGSVLCVACCLCLAWSWLLMVWRYGVSLRRADYSERSYKDIKYDQTVFKALLHKRKQINVPTDDYGILLGNPKGKLRIIVVSNPYCGHCAAAQPVLRDIIEGNDGVCIQMIFTANPDDSHYKDYPVDTFLNLYYEGTDMKSILDEWYSGKTNDAKTLREKYPVKKVDAAWTLANARGMYRFCEKTGIVATPTVFVNGYKLPDLYTISDLKYIV